jgi:peptidoglycan/LPS O-acetylase OafA/YrhL
LRTRHLDALDGLRAIAVGAVVLYHLSLPWARGGFLGVDLFFVLSGFLITSLLLEERSESGRIDLVAFWRRRARRLLPALYLMLIVVCLWPLVTNVLGIYAWSSVNLSTLRDYGISSVFYVTNWVVISSGHSYFELFALPTPLSHTWSLAIEEQFYIFWPLVTMLLLWRGVASQRRWRGALICAGIAVGSMALMIALVHPFTPSSINLVYNATYTRLFDLAAGAALAWLTVGREVTARLARALSVLGPACAVLVVLAMGTTGDVNGNPLKFMFDGGFLLFSILCAIVIAAVRVEGSPLSRVLSWSPFRVVGRTSYGIYLWHWPVIVLVTTLTVHLTGFALLSLRLVLVAMFTAASYIWLEQPIRQRRWPAQTRRVLAVGGIVVVIGAVLLGTNLQAYTYPNPRIAAARNAPTAVPEGSGGIVGASSFTWGADHPPSEQSPISVISVGDSLTAYAGPGMAAAVRAIPHVKFHNASGPGFGLTTVGDWRTSLSFDIKLFHPEIVLFTTTWDDGQALYHPGQYLRTLTAAGAFLQSRGVRGWFFESYPRTHTAQTSTLPASRLHQLNLFSDFGAAAWQNVVLRYVDAHPGFAAFLPIGSSVLIDGRTAFWMPPPRHPGAAEASWDRVRFLDGSHLCSVGVERFSAALSYDISTMLHVAPTAKRWWLGSWVNHPVPPRYASEVQGMCPIDHP